MLLPTYQGNPGKRTAEGLEECKEQLYQHLQSYIVTPSQESIIQV